MAQKYFITAQDVKEHTDIQLNVDDQQVEQRLARCQENYIRPVLGQALYDELCDALAAEPETPAPDNLDTLHGQLVPALAQWVFYKSLPFMLVKASNKALVASQDAPSDAQYKVYTKEVKEEAAARTEDLKRWLEANKANYPNYKAAARTVRPIGGIVF